MNLKRFFDIFVSLIGLIIFSPVFIILIIVVYVNLGKPVFFSQLRPGKNCKPFTIYKFRTMSNQLDNQGRILADNARLNTIGSYLRSTSLDEMPELLNVLKGDMSLVGPRPLLMDYIPLFNEFQNKRHSVKPGITGWAQINGRNAITWDKKFELDNWYVQNQSFLLDLKILMLTVIRVFKREGIVHNNDRPMPRFNGNKQ